SSQHEGAKSFCPNHSASYHMCDGTGPARKSGQDERGTSLCPSRRFLMGPRGIPLMTDLCIRLYWIMGLRMALVTLMLGLSLVFQVVKGGRVETFYTLIIVTYILTIPSVVLLIALRSSRALTIFFWTQVAIDFLLETVLVSRTG